MRAQTEGPPGPPPVLGLLNEVLGRYGGAMAAHMAAGGVDHSWAQSRLMGSIPTEGIRVTDLAARLGVTKQSCAQMVDELVAGGFLEKRADPVDARAKLIVFGPEGDRALPLAWAALHQVEDEMAQRIGPDGLERLRELLAGVLRDVRPGDRGS